MVVQLRSGLLLVCLAAAASACMRSGSTRQRVVVNGAIAVVGAAAVTYGVVHGTRDRDCDGTDACRDDVGPLLDLVLFGIGGAGLLLGGTIGLVSAHRDAGGDGAQTTTDGGDAGAALERACAEWERSYREAKDRDARARILPGRPTHCRRLSAPPEPAPGS